MSKLVSIQTLAAAVPAGARIAIGGFQLSRVPAQLLRVVADLHDRDLDVICGPNGLALEILCSAGGLRSADCGFIGFQFEDGFRVPSALRRSLADGSVSLRQRDVYETIGELRQAAEQRQPIADVAVLHAQRADAAGNLEIDDPYLDILLAGAARRVIATTEQIVDRVDAASIRGAMVEAIAECPAGAAPTACLGVYSRDVEALRRQIEIPADEAAVVQNPAVDDYIVNLARLVHDGEVVVTGLASAVPMLAIALAQRTHAPNARYINCIGAVNPKLDRPYSTSVEPALLHDCAERMGLADLFDLARDGGVDSMFFGAAQIDIKGNMNLSRIGPAAAPKAILPGPAGSPSMRSFVRRVLVGIPRQSRRNLVDQVDVATSVAGARNQETVLVTDRAEWRLGADGFGPTSVHRGNPWQDLIPNTGFSATFAEPAATLPPTEGELAALHALDPQGSRYRLLPHIPLHDQQKSPELATNGR